MLYVVYTHLGIMKSDKISHLRIEEVKKTEVWWSFQCLSTHAFTLELINSKPAIMIDPKFCDMDENLADIQKVKEISKRKFATAGYRKSANKVTLKLRCKKT